MLAKKFFICIMSENVYVCLRNLQIYAQKIFPPVGIRYVKRGIETKENRIFNKGENCWPLTRI